MSTNTSVNATRDQILDIGEALVERIGFNGFSYADIASQLGLTTASIHYHFPAKADLGVAIIDRYSTRLLATFGAIAETSPDPFLQLKQAVAFFDQAAASGRLRVSTALAAEFSTLPKSMKQRVVELYGTAQDWLTSVIQRGVAEGRFAVRYKPADVATAIAAASHGALLLARVRGDASVFRIAMLLLLAGLAEPLSD